MLSEWDVCEWGLERVAVAQAQNEVWDIAEVWRFNLPLLLHFGYPKTTLPIPVSSYNSYSGTSGGLNPLFPPSPWLRHRLCNICEWWAQVAIHGEVTWPINTPKITCIYPQFYTYLLCIKLKTVDAAVWPWLRPVGNWCMSRVTWC